MVVVDSYLGMIVVEEDTVGPDAIDLLVEDNKVPVVAVVVAVLECMAVDIAEVAVGIPMIAEHHIEVERFLVQMRLGQG